MYTTVSLYQLNALVAGNGSYIVRPCGHDLHGPTVTIVQRSFDTLTSEIVAIVQRSFHTLTSEIANHCTEKISHPDILDW